MNLEEKEINEDVDKGVIIKLRLKYPYVSDAVKAAKRINKTLSDLFCDIKKKALQSADYSYHNCVYRAYESENGYLSVYFELTMKGRDKAYSYTPFSFTFDERGLPVPLFGKIPKNTFDKVRAEFSERGIKLSKKEFLYSYYLTKKGAVVYAARRRGSGRHGCIRYEYELPPRGV
ncbi:MAG: hypothetical protein II135_10435 [Clostridia bacterium]|nr:hypothetical protein [Clostridia bacterium]